MNGKQKKPMSAERLRATPAVQKVSRWRLPNFENTESQGSSVEFVQKNWEGFFRAAEKALGLSTTKESSER